VNFLLGKEEKPMPFNFFPSAPCIPLTVISAGGMCSLKSTSAHAVSAQKTPVRLWRLQGQHLHRGRTSFCVFIFTQIRLTMETLAFKHALTSDGHRKCLKLWEGLSEVCFCVCVCVCVIRDDWVTPAAVELRGPLKAALHGGPSVLTGESLQIAASYLNGKSNCSSQPFSL